ncbi:PfkB family carbohydrate kinase [Paracoccus tibetensis]|uniref:PfkB family carbohydrate kinase n=1 Tax=Paracoccus tibetensis TaxID=336292 RepID=UPI001587E273|nr:PfkB family carbohydrate kinase [Paracoccus tibetensis]
MLIPTDRLDSRHHILPAQTCRGFATDPSVNAVELQQLYQALGGEDGLPGGLALLAARGAEGAEYVVGGQSRRVAAHQVPVIDTTGAGDVFLGVFLAELDGAHPVEAALTLAAAAAGAAVQVGRKGAVSAIPTRTEVEAASIAKNERLTRARRSQPCERPEPGNRNTLHA